MLLEIYRLSFEPTVTEGRHEVELLLGRLQLTREKRCSLFRRSIRDEEEGRTITLTPEDVKLLVAALVVVIGEVHGQAVELPNGTTFLFPDFKHPLGSILHGPI
jgi:hypothetical protein